MISHIRTFIGIAVFFACTVATAQTLTHGTPNIRGAVVDSIAHNLPGYQTGAPTLIFGLRARGCFPCIAGAINSTCSQFRHNSIKTNTITVVLGATSRQVPSIRKLFRYSNDPVFISDPLLFQTIFGEDVNGVGMELLDSHGNLLVSVDDLLHNPLEPKVLDSIHRSSYPAEAHLAREVGLQDSSAPILGVAGASYNPDTRTVTFCDINSNLILRYSTTDGTNVLTISPSDSLTFGFRGNGVDEKEWIDFLSNYPAPAAFGAILRPSTGDTIVATAKVVSGYIRGVRPDGDSVDQWGFTQCLITFVNGHAIDVSPLPDSDLYPFGSFYRGTNGSLIVQALIWPTKMLAADVDMHIPQFWYVNPIMDTIVRVNHPSKFRDSQTNAAIPSSRFWARNGDLDDIYIIKDNAVDVWGPQAVSADEHGGKNITEFQLKRSFEYCGTVAKRLAVDALWSDGQLCVLSLIPSSDGMRGGLFLTRVSDSGIKSSETRLELPQYRIRSQSLLHVDSEQIIVLAQSEYGNWVILTYDIHPK